MSYSYPFHLEIIKLVTEQNFGIREVEKLHHILHSVVISWLKAFREKGVEGVKSPCTPFPLPKSVRPKMKKKTIEVPEPTDLSPPKRLKSYNVNWLTCQRRMPT